MSRTLTGCKRCRETHQKCVVTPPNKECFRCINAGSTCVFESRTRFKAVHHVPLKGAGKGRGNARFRLSYNRRQPWVDIPHSLNFVTETGEDEGTSSAEDLDETEDFEDNYDFTDDQSSLRAGIITPSGGIEPSSGQIEPHRSGLGIISSPSLETGVLLPSNSLPPRSNPYQVSQPNSADSPSHTHIFSNPSSHGSPFSDGTISYQGSAGSNSGVMRFPPMSFQREEPTAISNATSPSKRPDSLLLSKREAYLMRNFVDVVSTWLDACDVKKHFAIEVPKHAFSSPVLLYAVLASSSQHQAQIGKAKDETESFGYYDECLRRLIPALDRHDEEMDEVLLAAVTILRIVEEFSADDTRCHLLGTTRLLNSISNFASSGGLGEACAWLSLRQNSYVTFVNQEPLYSMLGHYELSQAFNLQDEGSWANRIVFLFAKALVMAFGSAAPSNKFSWPQLRDQTDRWWKEKPHAFAPLWTEPISVEASRPFPQPWLLSAPQVVGMQHYHLTKIMIAAYTPQPPVSGFNALLQKMHSEDDLVYHLKFVLGIASANKASHLIGFFSASHALSVCGFMLRNEAEHEHCVGLLKEMSERIGWRTSLRRLEKQWGRRSSVSDMEGTSNDLLKLQNPFGNHGSS